LDNLNLLAVKVWFSVFEIVFRKWSSSHWLGWDHVLSLLQLPLTSQLAPNQTLFLHKSLWPSPFHTLQSSVSRNPVLWLLFVFKTHWVCQSQTGCPFLKIALCHSSPRYWEWKVVLVYKPVTLGKSLFHQIPAWV
jgi:hypothetical protein